MLKYEHVTFNETGNQLEGDDLVEFLSGHDKAITALEMINDYVLSHLPQLKVIGKYGVGLDMIDMNAMRIHGKRLGWIGGVNCRSVSELTVAFAIMMLRHLHAANVEVISGSWRQHIGGQLTGRTFGIVGCGHVGKDLVEMLKPFGCNILVNDVCDYSNFYIAHGIKSMPLEELLMQSDLISLHVPLNKSTYNLLNEQRLALIRPTAILLNTARGGLVDEITLKTMLKNGKLAAAAFDVFGDEPPKDVELLKLPNFFATPHIGGSSEEAILAMGRAAINGLDVNEIPKSPV